MASNSAPTVINFEPFLKDRNSQEAKDECKKLAQVLRETSCLVVRDPRVSEADNQKFLDMMEKYYDQPTELKMKDVHPELSYQLGATPEGTEVPRDHKDVIEKYSNDNSAHLPTGADPKWRYFWRIGERPKDTKYPELNAPPVIPSNFPDWTNVMNKWGGFMIQGVQTVCEMLAIGFDLPVDTFTNLMNHGPHLLAPTGSDLNKFNKVDTIMAGFHYDLNLFTIHGKSRFPGLFIWLRDGTRVSVKVPDGCLLLQAGKQLEWLTGGYITAGFHEVVVTNETLAAVEKAKAEKRPVWRVSSTLFSHVASDQILKPLAHFSNEESLKKYPPTLAGEQVSEELSHIKLAAPSN